MNKISDDQQEALRKTLEATSSKNDKKVLISNLIWAVLMFLLGIIVNILASLPKVQEYIFKFIYSIPIWGTVIILLTLGFLLFWVRSRFRLIYGFIEYTIGFITAINVFLPLGFDYSQIKPLAMLQVLGGAYIMVRGIDNLSIGVRGTRYEKYWDKVFGKRSS